MMENKELPNKESHDKQLSDREIWNKIIKILTLDKAIKMRKEYKNELIKGYKLCKNKTYNFLNLNEEESYFNTYPKEEAYYNECISK